MVACVQEEPSTKNCCVSLLSVQVVKIFVGIITHDESFSFSPRVKVCCEERISVSVIVSPSSKRCAGSENNTIVGDQLS